MSDKLDVTIGISADASGVEAGVGKAKKSLRSLGGSAKNVAQDVGSMGDGSDKAAKKVVRDTKSMERSLQSLLAKLEGGSRESRGYWEKIAEFKGVDKNALSPLLNQLDSYQAKQKQAVEATKSFSDSINGLQKAFVSAGAAAAAAKFISVADSVTVLNNQLKLATGSTESAALAYESLFQIAQRSRVGFTELGETFASITRAAAPLGLSQERLLRVTESIGNAMTISGGSAQGLQAALVQLSQGLSAGALRGDELNSVMEQAPRLAKALADGLGVTTGQLRAMGAEGQITAEKVIGALESQAGVLRGEVAGAALTVGQAFVQLGNSATHAIGSLDKATGASASAASAISAIASAINGLGQAAANNEAAIKAVLSFGAVIAGAKLATVAVGGVTTAFAAARIAVLGFSAALAASPIGFALVAVAALGASAYSAAVAMDAAGESAKGLEGAAAAAAEASAKEFKALQTAAEKAGSELSKAEKKLADLESRGAKGSSNLMLREAYNHTQRLVNKLREAKRVQDDLLRGSLGGAYTEGMGNNSEIVRRREAEAALAKEIKDYLTADARQTRAQIREEEISKARLKNAALIAKAEGDTNTVLQLQAALKTEIANIESRYKDSAAPRIKGDASAYATLSKRVNEYISQLALEAKQGDKVTAAQKLQIQLDELLASSKGKLAAAKVAGLKADIQSALSMEKEAAASKLAAEQAEEAAKAYDSVLDATMGRTKSVADQVKAEEEAAAAIGLSKEAVAALEMAKLSDMAATIERKALLMDDIDLSGQQSAALRAEAQAYRDLASVKGQRAVKQANADTAKKAKEDWEKVSKTIGDTLADYIMGGGKDAATYLKRLFATLVLQPVVQYGVQSILGGLGGSSTSGGSSGLPGGGLTDWSTWGSTASSLASDASFKLVSNGWTEMGSSMMGLSRTIESVDSYLKTIPGMEGGIGSAAGYLGSIYSLTQGNYGSGIGSAIGTAIMPGIGTMIGGALGGLVDDLFGSKFIPRIGGDVHYGSGGVIRGEGTPEIDRQDEFYKMLEPLALGIGQTLDSTARMFGLEAGHSLFLAFSMNAEKNDVFGQLQIRDASGEAIVDWAKYNAEWEGRLFSSGEEGTAEFMAALTEDVKFALLAMDLPGWSNQLIEAATDLDSLNQALQGVSAIKASFDALGRSMEMFTGISGELQTVLLETAGSMDGLMAGANAFYQGFYSERERMDRANAQIAQSLSELGFEINPYSEGSKGAFKTLVEEAMASGQGELAAKLLAMSAAFAETADYGTKLFEEMAQAAQEAREAAQELAFANLEAAFGREQDYWQGIASASQEAVSALTSTLSLLTSNARALYGTVDSTQQMLAAQGMVYIEDALSAVRGGGSITGFDQLQDAISAARGGISGKAYSSQFERERDALVLAGQLSELGELTGEQLSIEERQLKNAEAQLEGLDQTLKYWRQLLDGNASQIDATLSIPQAIEQMARLMGLDVDGGLGSGAGGVGGAGGSGDDGGASFGGGSGSAGASKPADKYDALRNVFRHYYGTGDEYGLLSSAKANGYTLRDVTAVSAAMYPDIWGGSTYEQWLEVAKGVGLPAFAGGGMHSGGLRLVGERGWEVEATGPSRIWNQQQLGQALGGGNNAELMAGMLAEMRALRAEVAALKSSSERTANNTQGVPQMVDQIDTVASSGRVRVTS